MVAANDLSVMCHVASFGGGSVDFQGVLNSPLPVLFRSALEEARKSQCFGECMFT